MERRIIQNFEIILKLGNYFIVNGAEYGVEVFFNESNMWNISFKYLDKYYFVLFNNLHNYIEVKGVSLYKIHESWKDEFLAFE